MLWSFQESTRPSRCAESGSMTTSAAPVSRLSSASRWMSSGNRMGTDRPSTSTAPKWIAERFAPAAASRGTTTSATGSSAVSIRTAPD